MLLESKEEREKHQCERETVRERNMHGFLLLRALTGSNLQPGYVP